MLLAPLTWNCVFYSTELWELKQKIYFCFQIDTKYYLDQKIDVIGSIADASYLNLQAH